MLKGKLISDKQGVAYIPSEEEIELLKTLQSNIAWHVYRKVLQQLKEGYFHSTLSMEETNKVMKTIGMVGGINLSINMLDSLTMRIDTKKVSQDKPE